MRNIKNNDNRTQKFFISKTILTNSIFCLLLSSFFGFIENCEPFRGAPGGGEEFTPLEKVTFEKQELEQQIYSHDLLLQHGILRLQRNQNRIRYKHYELQENQRRIQRNHLRLQENQAKLQDKQRISTTKFIPYAFGIVIARGVHSTLSWLNKKMRPEKSNNNKIYKTIQKDVQNLQLLSSSAAICGGKVHNYCNGPLEPVILSFPFLLLHGFFNVNLQILNAHVLQNCLSEFTDHSHLKKSNNRAVKIVRKLPKSIKNFSRLFIEWGLWRIETEFLHRIKEAI